MKRILFISHSFHSKTKSSDFFQSILEERYTVETLGIDPFQEETSLWDKIEVAKYDILIFWQIVYPPEFSDKFSKHNTIFVPMIDEEFKRGRDDYSRLYPYRNLKILAFCEVLHRRYTTLGLDSTYLQYFPEPKPFEGGDTTRAFFWFRGPLPLETILSHLDEWGITQLHVHNSPDPGYLLKKVSNRDQRRYNITYSTWFKERSELDSLLKERGVYIAPRLVEGIGMSYLNEMAKGKCVITPDFPTHSEYVEHGVTGFLFDPQKQENQKENQKQILCEEEKERVQKRSHDFIEEGRSQYLLEREKIYDLLERELRLTPISLWPEKREDFEYLKEIFQDKDGIDNRWVRFRRMGLREKIETILKVFTKRCRRLLGNRA